MILHDRIDMNFWMKFYEFLRDLPLTYTAFDLGKINSPRSLYP